MVPTTNFGGINEFMHDSCVRTYWQCMLHTHLNNIWTDTWITVTRRGICFWMVGYVQQLKCEECEKDGKVYVGRVRESEQSFEHLTKHEDFRLNISCWVLFLGIVVVIAIMLSYLHSHKKQKLLMNTY